MKIISPPALRTEVHLTLYKFTLHPSPGASNSSSHSKGVGWGKRRKKLRKTADGFGGENDLSLVDYKAGWTHLEMTEAIGLHTLTGRL